MGNVDNYAYYNVLGTEIGGGYTWYNLGVDSYVAGIEEVEFLKSEETPEPPASDWVEPVAVDENVKVNQIYISSGVINIRKEPSTKAQIMGKCKTKVFYNVLEVNKTNDYT